MNSIFLGLIIFFCVIYYVKEIRQNINAGKRVEKAIEIRELEDELDFLNKNIDLDWDKFVMKFRYSCATYSVIEKCSSLLKSRCYQEAKEILKSRIKFIEERLDYLQ